MTDAANRNLVEMVPVLDLFAQAEVCDQLWWQVKDGHVEFYVLVNDVFWWATADGEAVTADDVLLLRQCFDDLAKVDADYYLAELFAARKRGLRPQRPWLDQCEAEVLPLFLAAGPERDPKDEG